MSSRIKELRNLILSRKLYLESLFSLVEGDWKTSRFAPSISYWQTKILQSEKMISQLLDCVDSIGYAVSCINGTSHNYVRGRNVVVDFEKQSNYICLRKLDDSFELAADEISARVTKQRSQRWCKLRESSRITGSTLYKALGFGFLKDQQEHYDKVFHGIQKPISVELQKLFDYGTNNENNALATLLGKILPVYFPNLSYREDGCEMVPLGDSYAVISGDGSGVDYAGNTEVAFEFKCPNPDNKRTTGVHYNFPNYYTTQVLSQMSAKKCHRLVYLSFTPESATFFEGSFDVDIWKEVWKIAEVLYGKSTAKRPTRRDPLANAVGKQLDEYARKCQFIAEFPSLRYQACKCPDVSSIDGVFMQHGSYVDVQPTIFTFADLSASLESTMNAFKDTYDIVRKPAKEVIVTVVSDLDRLSTPFSPYAGHAVPIQYGFSGFSLTMTTARNFIGEAIRACNSRNLHVKVIAFDGQFLELAVSDASGKPLTVCKFMKALWEKVCKMPKNEKLSFLLHSSSQVGSPQNITKALNKKSKSVKTKDESKVDKECAVIDILKYLPEDLLKELDEETMKSITEAGQMATYRNAKKNEEDQTISEDSGVDMTDACTTDFKTLRETLISLNNGERSKCWSECSEESFRECFKNASTIKKCFRVDELKLIAKTSQKLLKHQLVAIVSAKFGDGSTVEGNLKSPKSLKAITEKHIRSWSVDAVNVAYAQMIFSEKFKEWNEGNQFQGSCNLVTDNGRVFHIPQWYAQPCLAENQLIQPIIDPHHIFVNNRVRCCSKSMSEMNIRKEAWWKAAESGKGKSCGLSLEIVKELRDKQSNAFAKTTFRQGTQKLLQEMGFHHEAEWCRLIRQWYNAIDDAGVPVDNRIEWLLDMREKLLGLLKVGHFPPPGAFVCDMPIAQFEGFLTNIDRRLQLYCMVRNETYNQRAISSLDSETFFSGFQDYDPKGTGILRPDDVTVALGAASLLYRHKLDGDRSFIMRTSKKPRVYPLQQIGNQENTYLDNDTVDASPVLLNESSFIRIHSHQFDKEERKSKNPKRKSGTISAFGLPSKGAEGVRSHHKNNEEKILPHRRFGFTDEEVDIKMSK